MAKKRAFRRAPVWKRNDGPFFSFFRLGDRLLVDFEYTPTRVGAVKSVKGARYHAEDKSWSVPFADRDSLHHRLPIERKAEA